MSEYLHHYSTDSFVLHRKFVIIGDRGVGKSALAERFVTGRFFGEVYEPTIENTLRKTIGFRNMKFNVEIVDTAGIDEYSSLSRNAAVGVHGYILCYSIISRQSIEKLKFINDMLFNMIGNPPSVPRVIVGTMLDAADQRAVSYDQGISLANQLGVPFLECSSKTGEYVGEAFSALLAEVEKENPTEVTGRSEPACIIT